MPGRHGKQRMKKRKSRRERPTEMEVTLKDSIHNRIRKEKAILAPMIPPTVPRYTAKIPTNTASLILAGAGKNAVTGVSSTAQLLMPTFAAATAIRSNANNAKRPTAANSTTTASNGISNGTKVGLAEKPTTATKEKSTKRPREEDDAAPAELPAEKARQVEGTSPSKALAATVTSTMASTPNSKAAKDENLNDNAVANSSPTDSKSPRRNARKSKEPSAAVGDATSPKSTPIIIPSVTNGSASPKTKSTAVVETVSNPTTTQTDDVASPVANSQKRQRSSSKAKQQQEASVTATPMAALPPKDDDNADVSPVPLAAAATTNGAVDVSQSASPKGRRSKKVAESKQHNTAETALFATSGDNVNPRSTTMLAPQGISAASPRPSIKATSVGSFQSANSEAAASPVNPTKQKRASTRRRESGVASLSDMPEVAPSLPITTEAAPVVRGSALSSVKSFFSSVSSKLFSPTASSSAKTTIPVAPSTPIANNKKRGGNSSASPAAVRDVLSPQSARKAATPSAKSAASPKSAAADRKPRWR